MKYYRNPETLEVYAYEADGSQDRLIPPSLVEMTPEEIDMHINPRPLPLTRGEVNALRKTAYANPLTGSDPLYIEYQRSVATGASEEDIHASKSAWLARAEEIAVRYPWPE